MSNTSLINEKERAQIDLEGDVSLETTALNEVVTVKTDTAKNKKQFTGPPKPYHRDGMGGYKVPAGGKPLTVNDIPGPGPNKYYPEYSPVVKKYPGWTFGEKESEKPKMKIPAPNKYNTSGDMKWGKCKTITLKHKIAPICDDAMYPGPATYTIQRSVSHGPRFSMRLKPKSELVPGLVSTLALHADPQVPGPKYNLPPDQWLKKPQSFGIKHKEMKRPTVPGRCSQQQDFSADVDVLGPEKYLCRTHPAGPKWIMGDVRSLHRISAPTPGPQKYSLKSTIGEAPKYSMGCRLQPSQVKSTTPGPDVYNSAGIRLDEPGYTMKYRWFDTRPEKIPGPYTYSDEKIRKKTPAFTMSIKGKLSYPSSVYSNFREEGPAPNQYNVPRDPLRQGKTVSIKLKDTDHREVPGPADYQNTEHINVNQRRSPAYSLGKKFTTKLEKGPGPGAYDVKYQDFKPGKTFGVKSQKKEHVCGPDTMLYPADIDKVCGSCEYNPGATLKSRHTPHKYLGLKDSSLIPIPANDTPKPPLFG